MGQDYRDAEIGAVDDGNAVIRFPSLQSLAGLAQRPLAEHADVYQQLHSELQGALAEIDGM